MLRKIAIVGRGNKWHIAHSPLLTYCGLTPNWISEEEREIAKFIYLCGSCKRELEKEVK